MNTKDFITKYVDLCKNIGISIKADVIERMVEIASRNKSKLNEILGIENGITTVEVDIQNYKRKALERVAENLAISLKSPFHRFEIETNGTEFVIKAFSDKETFKHISPSDLIKITQKENILVDFKAIARDELKVVDPDDDFNVEELFSSKCIYKVVIATSHPLLLLSGESPKFDSCQAIGYMNHIETYQNLMNGKVFLIGIVDDEWRLLSRAWVYTDDEINRFWIGRIYNGTEMPGVVAIGAIEAATGKYFRTKIDEPEYLGLSVSGCCGYFEASQNFILMYRDSELEDFLLEFKEELLCTGCGRTILPSKEMTVPICDRCDKSFAICIECGRTTKDFVEVNKEKVCFSCFNRFYFRCDICGKYNRRLKTLRVEFKDLNSGSIKSACESCYNRRAIVVCSECGSLVEKKMACEVEYGYACVNCISERKIKYGEVLCRGCGRFVLQDKFDFNTNYCKKCSKHNIRQ